MFYNTESMKKNIYLTSILCGCMAFGAISCDNPGEPQFENDEFTSVLYLKDSGQVPVDFYNVDKDIVFTTAIGKGGTEPSISRDGSLNVFTQEEMDAYNEENATNFAILPAECYEFTQDYAFEGETESQPVNITLKKGLASLDENTHYALPLKLTSSKYNVNAIKSTILLLPEVITPQISLTTTGEQSAPELSIHNESTTFTTSVLMNMNNLGWEFSVSYETDPQVLQSLADIFIATKGGGYTLLPAENYELAASVFAGTEREKELNIKILSKGLDNGKYVIPVAINSITGVPFEYSTEVCYITVTVSDLVNITSKDLYANSAENRNSNLVANVIDGNFTNGWQSEWYLPQGESPLSDPKYGVYIDIKNITNISEVMDLSVWISTTHNNAKHIQFYAGTSEDDLKLVHENEDCYPDRMSNKLYQTGKIKVGKISMIRIACIKSQSNGDLRKITSSNVGQNVSISEVKVYGH